MSTHVVTFEQVIQRTVKKTVTLELAHCPFCGGEAEFRVGGNYSSKHNKRMGIGVRCIDCKAVTPTREGSDNYERATSEWNRRVRA